MSATAAARRLARASGNLLPNGQWVPDWSMPPGTGSGLGLDDLEINPNRIDDIPPGVAPEDLVDPYPVVPPNWDEAIPTDVTLRPGEDPNLAGAAAPLNLDAPLTPRPAPNDMPGTRPSRPSPDLDDAVPNRNAAPDPSSSDARARALALATLGGAGILSMYDFFPPGSDTPGGYTPVGRPGASPPGGFPPGFDPPFPPGPTANKSNWSEERRRGVDEEQMIRRLAKRAGIPYDQAKKMVQAGYDEQDIGHVIGKKDGRPDFDQRKQAYEPVRTMGHSVLDSNQRARQAEVVRRAQSQYNPMATLSPEWREFVMAESLLGGRGRAGASPNDIRARELATAAQLATSAVQQSIRGGIAGQQMQLQMEQAERERVRGLRATAADAAAAPAGGFLGEPTIEQKRERAARAIQLEGATAEETQQIVDEMFPLPRAPGA